MNIDTHHGIDRTTYPPKPAIITLTIGDVAHELTPAQTREAIEALTRELNAIESWQFNVHMTNNPADAAHMSRSEWIEAGRQRQREAVAAQQAADAAEHARQAQEAADRRAAVYAARKAEDNARWQARAQRIAQTGQDAQQQEADK